MHLLRLLGTMLRRLLGGGDTVQQFEDRLMPKIEDLLQEVRAVRTKADSLNTLLDGVRQNVQEILQNGGVSAAVQAKIDEAFAEAIAAKASLTEAIDENTGLGQPTTPPGGNTPTNG